jgi:hypothetical protein
MLLISVERAIQEQLEVVEEALDALPNPTTSKTKEGK